MKFNKLRIFNSFILSILLNTVFMFLIVWIFTPEIREKLTSSPIEVNIIKIKLPRHPPTPPSSIGSEAKLPYMHKTNALKHLTIKSSNLTTAFNPETEFTPAETDYTIAPDLELSADYKSKHSGFSISLSTHRKSKVTTRKLTGNIDGLKRSQTFLDSLWKEANETPEASIGEEDGSITGYYNISLIKYEDTAEQFRNAALENLADAMNRWTSVNTKVLPDTIPLDSRKIMNVPLIYIAAKDAFVFSEKERANLRSYLKAGGTLLFSNITSEDSAEVPVDNSVRFELWKILGENVNFIDLSKDRTLCNSVFEFDEHPLHKKDKLYGIELNGRISVIYDVAGYGRIWAEDKSSEYELKFGVNLLVYVLLNSPIVSH